MNKDLYELSYSLKKDFEKKVLSIVFVVTSVFVVLNLILVFLFFPLKISSVSMNPDIAKDSVVLFSPLKKSVKRGDVVLLKERSQEKKSKLFRVTNCFVRFFTAQQISLDNLNQMMGSQNQVRRIIGIPGDTIYMRDYVMYIKPAGEKYFLTEFELVQKSYNVNINTAPALWDSSMGVAGSFDEIVLGDSDYFVLGDYRNSCVDSRLWGPVNFRAIKATAFLCYFPFNRISLY